MIREQATLRRIAEAGMPQTRSLQTGVAAIAIAMPEEKGKAVSQAFDEGRAAERILVAATMIGLGAGIAWILAPARETVSGLLHLPEDWRVRTIVALGHPRESGRRPKSAPGKARLPRDEVVFNERWPEG